MYQKIISAEILKYLDTQLGVNWKNKNANVKSLYCPICNDGECIATIIPVANLLRCAKQRKKYSIVDLVRVLEKKEGSDEEIYQHLKGLLNIKVKTKNEQEEINKLLDFYKENGFDLVPIARGQKRPIEKAWQNKHHTDKSEWLDWLANGLNLGVKTGAISNVLVIDVDTKPTPKEILECLDGVETLTQETPNGTHLFFKYDDEFPKTRIDKFKVDIETNGGQCVISPSVTDGKEREMILNEIKPIPEKLKKLLLNETTVNRKTNSELIRENIQTENFKIKPEDFKLKYNNLEGCCNTSFISLGGILRKQLNPTQTEFTLQVLNRHLLESPMDNKTVSAMCSELEKYDLDEDAELKHEILKHLKEVEISTASDLELVVAGNWTKGKAKKRINKALRELINDEKIVRKGKEYHLVKKVGWTDKFMEFGTPLDFKVPYFHNYAHFTKGDLILIGGVTGQGKTILGMNIVKRLVKQGIKPYYIYTESGGRFSKTAIQLGLKEGDFYLSERPVFSIEEINIKPNSVVIYDWIETTQDFGFAQLNLLFQKIVQKAHESNSIFICFIQIRKSGEAFAKDLTDLHASLFCKYQYKNPEGTETEFKIEKVRDEKIRNKRFSIPCVFDYDTREVFTVEELENK